MEEIYSIFTSLLEKEDKEQAVTYIIDKVRGEEIGIVDLYEKILGPALRSIAPQDEAQEIDIWREHVRSGIVRTIVECCYPYVLRERDQRGVKVKNRKVVILCPSEEYHEIGPRMVADFFTLCGYTAIFVGGNTPKEDFQKSIEAILPYYVAISISNYYHIIAAERAIQEIRKNTIQPAKIILGGGSFDHNPYIARQLGGDLLLSSFQDIQQLAKEDDHETRL